MYILPWYSDELRTYLIKEFGVLKILAALLQLGQRLQQLHGRGNLGQVALAHKILHKAPHIDALWCWLLRQWQGRAPLPLRLILQGICNLVSDASSALMSTY